MKPLDSIYLVANLSAYDFRNVVLLADDVATIATELATATDRDCVECCEKLLFLGHVLATALDASRRIVGNFGELEELLRVNWADCGRGEADRKWAWVREESARGMLNRVARRVLMAEGGERCVGVVREFYRKYSDKGEFRRVLGEVAKGLVWRESAQSYLRLKGNVQPEVGTVLDGLDRLRDFRGDKPEVVLQEATRWNLPALVSLQESTSIESKQFTKILTGITVILKTGNENFLQAQLKAIKEMTQNETLLKNYQKLTKFQPFYQANLELLRTHQKSLKSQDLIYDSTTILLCHLIYQQGCQPERFREDFLNLQAELGQPSGPENLELVLAEMQNFAG